MAFKMRSNPFKRNFSKVMKEGKTQLWEKSGTRPDPDHEGGDTFEKSGTVRRGQQELGVGPFKQTSKSNPKLKTEMIQKMGSDPSITVTKGARSSKTLAEQQQGDMGVAREKGKRKVYSPPAPSSIKEYVEMQKQAKKGKTVTKEVYKKKKGAASVPETWKHKKTKTITEKKATRQVKRASKQIERQGKRLKKALKK